MSANAKPYTQAEIADPNNALGSTPRWIATVTVALEEIRRLHELLWEVLARFERAEACTRSREELFAAIKSALSSTGEGGAAGHNCGGIEEVGACTCEKARE